MSKFIFVYHGGTHPETEEEGQKVMAEWMAWFETMGSVVAEMGAPVGPSSTVQSNGSVSDDGGANPVGGYSLVHADDINGALELAKGCPILKAGGSVEVAAVMEM